MKRLKKNALMVRHVGKLGATTHANRPTMIEKGTIYEHVRLVDKHNSYIRIGNMLYMAKNKDLTLREQAGAPPVPQSMADFAPIPQKNVSLDQVIDRYVVRYERESIPQTQAPGPGPMAANAQSPETTLAETRSLRSLMSMLFEQDAPPDEPPPDDAAGGDAGADAGAPPDDAGGGADAGGVGGGGGGAPAGAPVVNTPKINLNEFSRSVARMINNYDALLNPRSIILNRVEAYIQSNYDERTAKMFIQIMERNYGLHTTNTEYSSTGNGDNNFAVPYSANAGGEAEQLAGGGKD
jgi:hypothetical protein